MGISGDEGVAMGAETQGAGAVGEIFDVEDVIGADVAGVFERGVDVSLGELFLYGGG